MSAVLVLDRVTKRHGDGRTVVDALVNVSLSVQPGELVAVMGPSGSGKSTLLGLSGGLDTPSEGRVTIGDVDLASQSISQLAGMRRRRIGFVFQDFNLVPGLSAIENVSLPMELDHVPLKSARSQAADALELVGLSDLAKRFPEELSGGEQQRVAIARAVVGERQLLLADEPTGALDTLTGENVMRLLRHSCDQRNVATIIVTHNPTHAAWADRIVFLRDGHIVDQTSPTGPDVLLAERY